MVNYTILYKKFVEHHVIKIIILLALTVLKLHLNLSPLGMFLLSLHLFKKVRLFSSLARWLQNLS